MFIHSRTFATIRAGVLACFLLASHNTRATEIISGVPRIVDGDTFQIGEVRVRFGTPALDGDAFFWRVTHVDGNDQYLIGYVNQEDLILAEPPVAS
jgi:endonuclease YncB( thermonuclease family)